MIDVHVTCSVDAGIRWGSCRLHVGDMWTTSKFGCTYGWTHGHHSRHCGCQDGTERASQLLLFSASSTHGQVKNSAWHFPLVFPSLCSNISHNNFPPSALLTGVLSHPFSQYYTVLCHRTPTPFTVDCVSHARNLDIIQAYMQHRWVVGKRVGAVTLYRVEQDLAARPLNRIRNENN